MNNASPPCPPPCPRPPFRRTFLPVTLKRWSQRHRPTKVPPVTPGRFTSSKILGYSDQVPWSPQACSFSVIEVNSCPPPTPEALTVAPAIIVSSSSIGFELIHFISFPSGEISLWFVSWKRGLTPFLSPAAFRLKILALSDCRPCDRTPTWTPPPRTSEPARSV